MPDKEPIETPKNALEKLHESIEGAPKRLEAELSRTENNWLSSYGSSLFAMQGFLHVAGMDGLIPEDEVRIRQKRLTQLKQDLADARRVYGEATPPEDIQRSLLENLDIFRDQEEESDEPPSKDSSETVTS